MCLSFLKVIHFNYFDSKDCLLSLLRWISPVVSLESLDTGAHPCGMNMHTHADSHPGPGLEFLKSKQRVTRLKMIRRRDATNSIDVVPSNP